MSEFERCLKEGKIQKIKVDDELINKELNASYYDLQSAKNSFIENDYKWAIVKSYYSMFHACRSLLYSRGYREKSHYCLLIAIKELFVEKGTLENEHYLNFKFGMELRHSADYGSVYSKESAEIIIENAENLLKEAKKKLELKK